MIDWTALPFLIRQVPASNFGGDRLTWLRFS